MRRGETLGVGAAIAALVFGGLPVGGATGRLVDPEGNPVAGARIRYVAAGTGETFCDRTAADRRCVLPGGSLPSLRISAKGFFVRSVPADDRVEPIVLARLVDARDGRALDGGEVHVAYAWGEERGPYPANAAGVEIGSLAPVREGAQP